MFWVIAGIVSPLLMAMAWHWTRSKIERRKYPAIGKMVDVGGYKLHLYRTGSGGPAVILDAGIGCISTHWDLVQSELSSFTTVASYDRAGLGWSESGPAPRTSLHIVQELHTLLENAQIPKPYLLVGHSFGGLNVQLYAATYPNDVCGLVLIDSPDEQVDEKLPSSRGESIAKLLVLPGISYLIAATGLYRWFIKRLPTIRRSSLDQANLAVCTSTKHACAFAAQTRCLAKSFKQLAAINRTLIQDKPCVVITAGRSTALWKDLQKTLASRFHRSQHLIAENSDHMIPLRQPEIIVTAVKELIQCTVNKKQNAHVEMD